MKLNGITGMACLLMLLPAACGFTPLYGQGDGAVGAVFSQVQVANIPDREGQKLRNILIDRFYRNGPPADPRYVLSITPLREGLSGLDITIDSEATREQVRLAAQMTVADRKTGAVVLSRVISAASSYNILGSQFTTRVSRDNARDNVIADMARQIETQLALAIERQAAPAP